jgi:integrase
LSRNAFAEPKSARGRRTLALPPFVVAALREHRRRQLAERLLVGSKWEGLDLVFCNQFGRPLEATNLVKRSCQPILERAGLPRIRFHDLRHTAATLLLSQGESVKLVAEQLGHADVALTLRVYGHVLPNQQRSAAMKLDASSVGPSSWHQKGRPEAELSSTLRI